MKRLVIVMTVLASFLWAACQMPEDEVKKTPETPAEKYAKEYWGEWLRMDTGEKWYISGTSIKINGAASSKTPALAKQSSRVVEVSDGGRKYYLYASRVANASFTGRIAAFDQSPRSAAGGRTIAREGWADKVALPLLAQNLDNGSSTTAKSDADGNFTVPDIIPGDRYQITPEGGRPAIVTPVSDGEDVGTITISDGVNFKTSIEPQSANTNMAELYAGTSYRMNIFVTNTGTVDCTAPTFQLDFGAGLVIEPGWTQVIPITVKCSQMGNENEYEYKKIGVTITDPHSNRNWQDSVSLKFYRGPVTFNIRANREFFGVIIAPSTQAYSFRGDGYYHDEYKYIITMPWVAGDYLAVFSGATAGTETLYSLGINREADSNFHDLSDSANYEPNNTEDTATPIAAQSKIMSYLHKNDIDYYKISLGSSVSVFKPAAMTNFAIKEAANGNGDDKANPRETLYLDIQVKNSGFSGTTSGVIAVLTSASSGYVTIDKNTAEIGDLTVGYYKTLTDNRFGSPFDYSSYLMYTSGLAKAFKFTVLESCPVNTDIPFTVTFTDSGGNSWTDTLTIQAVSMDAHIAITDFAIGRSWDWDDDANPGATPYLDIRVKNTGTSKAHGVNAVLTTASSYVTIDKGTAAIGDLRAGYYKTLTDDSSNNSASFVFIPSLMYHESRLYCAFKFTVSASCPVNTVIPFTVTFTDYLGNTWTDTLTVRVVE